MIVISCFSNRDLKPENILCGENLDDLKIADFGLSKVSYFKCNDENREILIIA